VTGAGGPPFVDRDPRALARALSAIENDPSAASWLAEVRTRPRRARVIGITGPPGAGKSTLVDRLVTAFRGGDETVAVLAVDPSSPVSGGALLGDRVRMQAHAADPGVFIRSMAARGQLGGVAAATSDAATILDAAGFDVVLIETVGVGQAEIAVVSIADVVVVVLVPGSGDEVQALKAGIMEVGDIFAINKSDRAGADELAASVRFAVSLSRSPGGAADGPPVIQTVATTGAGLPALVAALRQAPPRARTTGVGSHARVDARNPAAAAAVLDHVAFAAPDAAPVLAFLGTAFGAVPGPVERVDAHGVRVRFVAAGGADIEVLEPAAEASAVAAFLTRRGAALHHVALRVENLSSVLAALKAHGVRLIDETPRPGARGTRVAFVHPSSAGGLLVELVERGRSTDR
jgi:LAO/AO transport system kinase